MLKFFSQGRSLSFLTLFSVSCLSMSAYANADLTIVKAYFTPGETTIEEIDSSPNLQTTQYNFADENFNLDLIVNIGKFLWDIIQVGQATVDVKTDFANALPVGLKVDALSNWQDPLFKTYKFTFKNFLGMRAVHFNYKVSYTHGGQYNGNGRYLANVIVVPSKIYVMWGYNLSADVTVPKVVNAGSKENPIAGMQLHLHWKISSIFSTEENTKAYYVRGDGAFSH